MLTNISLENSLLGAHLRALTQLSAPRQSGVKASKIQYRSHFTFMELQKLQMQVFVQVHAQNGHMRQQVQRHAMLFTN